MLRRACGTPHNDGGGRLYGTPRNDKKRGHFRNAKKGIPWNDEERGALLGMRRGMGIGFVVFHGVPRNEGKREAFGIPYKERMVEDFWKPHAMRGKKSISRNEGEKGIDISILL